MKILDAIEDAIHNNHFITARIRITYTELVKWMLKAIQEQLERPDVDKSRALLADLTRAIEEFAPRIHPDTQPDFLELQKTFKDVLQANLNIKRATSTVSAPTPTMIATSDPTQESAQTEVLNMEKDKKKDTKKEA